MTDLRIDGHKLAFHPERVAAWRRGEQIYPIYVEVSPFGACNHRCIFCAFDYLGYRRRAIDAGALGRALHEMGRGGVRSAMYSGEGEPLLHPEIVDLVRKTRESGIDVAIASNGVFFTPEVASEVLPNLTWIRVSLNAGDAPTHALVHGCPPADFDKVLSNLAAAVEMRAARSLRATIGIQFVLLPENLGTAASLARLARDVGVDYVTFKPYIQHPSSGRTLSRPLGLDELDAVRREVEPFSRDGFQIVFRAHAARKLASGRRGYERCLGTSFFCEIVSSGEVYTCGPYLGQADHAYGNVHESSFDEIWLGPRRRSIRRRIEEELDTAGCMPNCRLDEVNRYLWELTHPSSHVNFI